MSNVVRIYIDESCHLENDNYPVMSVGGLYVAEDTWLELSEGIKRIKRKYHSPTELKWNKVSASRMPLYKELIDFFFEQRDLTFRALLIKHKEDINNERYNDGDHNIFYYKTMFYLIRDSDSPNRYKVYNDRDRANKIHWIKVIIENCSCPLIKRFEKIDRDGDRNIFLWLESKSYVVILREKQPDLFLVTGYCVDATEQGRFRREYMEYKNKKTPLRK